LLTANFGDVAAHVLYDWGVSCGNVGGGLRLDLHVWTRGPADGQSRSPFWQNEPKRKNAANSMRTPARAASRRTTLAQFFLHAQLRGPRLQIQRRLAACAGADWPPSVFNRLVTQKNCVDADLTAH
jgi:hypothetical protein